jgi:proteasome lid subunit RPN8/RPN11
LSEEIARRIRVHAVDTYPYECCGALLGVDGAEGREVRDLMALENRREDSPQNRFSIAPEDFRAAERAARERDFEIIGWYHSHPDAAARPSQYDREHAWPWYSYVVIGVEAREPREMTSWRLADDRSRFQAEAIEVEARARI